MKLQKILLVLTLMLSTTVGAQNAEKLYKDGKALYDAEKYTEAVPKLKAAAEKGHKKAQYRLGRCYEKGRGVKESDAIAFQWYSKSAAQDYAKAQFQLGQCYKDGKGVEKNPQKAFNYFAKAAKQDNGDAQLALGKCYLKGRGTAVDKAKAKTWLTRAVKNEKDGDDILDKLRKKASAGDNDAKEILTLTGKNK
jgi:TPR repeat protein